MKKWLPGDGGDEYLWSEDIEKPEKYGRTPAKVVSKPLPTSLRDRAIALVTEHGTVRTSDFEAIGVPRQYPPMMCREGSLEKVGYGRYRLASSQVAKRRRE